MPYGHAPTRRADLRLPKAVMFRQLVQGQSEHKLARPGWPTAARPGFLKRHKKAAGVEHEVPHAASEPAKSDPHPLSRCNRHIRGQRRVAWRGALRGRLHPRPVRCHGWQHGRQGDIRPEPLARQNMNIIEQRQPIRTLCDDGARATGFQPRDRAAGAVPAEPSPPHDLRGEALAEAAPARTGRLPWG